MIDIATEELKLNNLKLRTQTKQLHVVQGIINRTTGYAKAQAEASEKRLKKEIATLKNNIESLQGNSKK